MQQTNNWIWHQEKPLQVKKVPMWYQICWSIWFPISQTCFVHCTTRCEVWNKYRKSETSLPNGGIVQYDVSANDFNMNLLFFYFSKRGGEAVIGGVLVGLHTIKNKMIWYKYWYLENGPIFKQYRYLKTKYRHIL